jgi:hypothetical protein
VSSKCRAGGDSLAAALELADQRLDGGALLFRNETAAGAW